MALSQLRFICTNAKVSFFHIITCYYQKYNIDAELSIEDKPMLRMTDNKIVNLFEQAQKVMEESKKAVDQDALVVRLRQILADLLQLKPSTFSVDQKITLLNYLVNNSIWTFRRIQPAACLKFDNATLSIIKDELVLLLNDDIFFGKNEHCALIARANIQALCQDSFMGDILFDPRIFGASILKGRLEKIAKSFDQKCKGQTLTATAREICLIKSQEDKWHQNMIATYPNIATLIGSENILKEDPIRDMLVAVQSKKKSGQP
jgi:hypothetical protein